MSSYVTSINWITKGYILFRKFKKLLKEGYPDSITRKLDSASSELGAKMESKYYTFLSKERKEIKKRLKKEKDPKVKLKLALPNMVASGMSVKVAASFLGIKLRTKWKKTRRLDSCYHVGKLK